MLFALVAFGFTVAAFQRSATRREIRTVARDRGLTLGKRGIASGQISSRAVTIAPVRLEITWTVLDAMQQLHPEVIEHGKRANRERGRNPRALPGAKVTTSAPKLSSAVSVSYDGVGFEVIGDETLAPCLLDGRSRRALMPGDCLRWHDGELSIASPFGPLLRRVDRTLEWLVELAASLPLSRERVPGRLSEIATFDSDLDARKTALHALLSHFPETSEAEDFVRTTHPPAIRFEIARRASDDDAIAMLADLVSSAERDRVVYYLLRGKLDRRRALELVLQAPDEVFENNAIIRLIGEERWTDLVPKVRAEAERAHSDSKRRALIACFADLADPVFEPKLVEWLVGKRKNDVSEASDVQAIADALGRLGTVESVPALRKAQQESTSAASGQAIETAIELIQARARAPAAGSLALADHTEQGGLSHAEPTRGALSEVEEVPNE